MISVDTWKWINFTVLAGGIGYLFVKSGLPVLRAGREKILEDLAAAEARGEAAEAKAAEIETRLAGLATAVAAIRAEARQEMESEARRIEAQTVDHAAKIERMAQVEIGAAAKEASASLRAHAAELALKLAEQKVAQRLTPAASHAMTERFVAGLRAEGRNR